MTRVNDRNSTINRITKTNITISSSSFNIILSKISIMMRNNHRDQKKRMVVVQVAIEHNNLMWANSNQIIKEDIKNNIKK